MDHQRRAAVAEKGQGDTGIGDQIGDNTDIQEHLNIQQDHDAHNKQRPKFITGMQRQPVTAPSLCTISS